MTSTALSGAAAYLAGIADRIADLTATQSEAIGAAAAACVETIRRDGLIYIFGTGHSHLMAEEGHFRAGGLACVVPILASSVMLHEGAVVSGALVESDRAHRRRSTLDPLTGLFNRNALEQRLAELDGQPSSGKKGLSHALLLCDLDHFKRVNDKLGHAAGDAVLKDVADTMRAVLRAGDSIYRIGGEEILVVLPGATEVDAVGIAERLRQAVRKRRPAGVEVTISIGAAVSGSPTVNTDDLVARADVALYSAKAGGRDQVFVAN